MKVRSGRHRGEKRPYDGTKFALWALPVPHAAIITDVGDHCKHKFRPAGRKTSQLGMQAMQINPLYTKGLLVAGHHGKLREGRDIGFFYCKRCTGNLTRTQRHGILHAGRKQTCGNRRYAAIAYRVPPQKKTAGWRLPRRLSGFAMKVADSDAIRQAVAYPYGVSGTGRSSSLSHT